MPERPTPKNQARQVPSRSRRDPRSRPDRSAKERHTAKRIYERLRDEYGYTGCSSQVRAAVARSKHYAKEVFVPLSHPRRPGPVRLRRGDGRDRGRRGEGRAGGDDASVLGRPSRVPPSRRAHRGSPPLVGEVPGDEVGEQVLHDRGVLGVAVPQPHGHLRAVGRDNERHDAAALRKDDAVDHEHGDLEAEEVLA